MHKMAEMPKLLIVSKVPNVPKRSSVSEVLKMQKNSVFPKAQKVVKNPAMPKSQKKQFQNGENDKSAINAEAAKVPKNVRKAKSAKE